MERFHRGRRLAETARLKKARKRYWGYERSYEDGQLEKMDERRLGLVASTPKPNQCACCSQVRKHQGRTISELCAMQKELQE